jgi:hypothetical protein
VLVDFNTVTAYEPTLQAALDTAFGAAAGTGKPPPSTGPGTQPPPTGAGTPAAVRRLVTQLATAQADADRALRAGDLTAYAAAEKRISALIKRLQSTAG